ncbi:putative L,D-transpeptidase ErfK/SrfK precursor [Methylobrevis pamukkalensis]|uniref:Putative L,D-transpeptidase ErfK/SrfK n=1 Tax=Methylobrevis pamukkalensis TaxID=1439726 RepID=A0A1E3H5X4_9HYPH|nr:L,D-transpeptidase [Methylobrevis pamukkalensis]ODN71710.1 putative L,D-transpeptidase ErfK/SrfK precursor [Methylobrevis pamukkalensis]
MQLRPGNTPIYAAPKAHAGATRLPDPARPEPTLSYAPPATAHPAALRPAHQISAEFLPTVVDYEGPFAPGTIVIDTESRHLMLVEENNRARRYGVGVGRPGFTWAGSHRVTRKAEWPGWTPPPEMRKRQPELPSYMPGGPQNPLGARALYLGSTLYRIHGTSQPWTIGQAVSSGCIRMRNEDVTDLYNRVPVGARVVVLR